jgi:hypothetical protein
MKIEVDRFISDNDTTISHVLVDGRFICFGLEDEYRATKVVNETRIPSGVYKVGLRTYGDHHQKYEDQYPVFHRGMLQIQAVPNFEDILIHIGNTHVDTSGCLLVGDKADLSAGHMEISGSRAAYERFYPLVVDAAAEGQLEIEFKDNDLK